MVEKLSHREHSPSSSGMKTAKKFIRHMLKNHTFIGSYIEQRYVPELNCYRKIIKIANTEDIFIESLIVCKKKIDNFFSSTKWVGFTIPNTVGAPVGFNLWVDIEQEVFGTYQFNVKDVNFTDKEISVELTVLNFYQDESKTGISKIAFENDMREIFTWYSFKEALFFSLLVATTIVAGTGKLLVIVLDYSLKFLSELNNTIKVLTPIIIACFDSISKMFGYICFMIASLFRSNPNNTQQLYYHKPDYPYNGHRYRALPYNNRSSVQITEISD